MIVSTNRADTMLKKCVGKNEVAIIAADKMFDQLKLDPTVMNPVRHVYVVTDDDIKGTRVKTKFEQCVSTKHPAAKVLFICKKSESAYPNGYPGIDAILVKPKVEELTSKLSDIISGDVSAVIRDDMGGHDIPAYQPQRVEEPVEVKEEVQAPMEEVEIDVPIIPEEKTEPEPVIKDNSGIVERIRSTSTVHQISEIAREIEATTIIKELIDTNTTFAAVEEKLKTISDSIYYIMNDRTIPTLDEKMSKVRALMHDKTFFAAKGDSIMEQRVEEIIDTICAQTSNLLTSRLNEIDTAIRRVQTQKEMDAGNARLAGLNEEKVNLILELRTLEGEIDAIFKASDRILMSSATEISSRASNPGGNPLLEQQLKARGDYIVSTATFDAIRMCIDMSVEKTAVEFKEMRLKVVQMIGILNKLFELDREIILAQQATINFLRAHNIEDTVIAETLLKKSLRVFIGVEGTGRTIIPYLLSMYKSRTNANVLMLDLTGTGKYDHYGLQVQSPEDYFVNMNQKEFCLVAGHVENTIATAQRIVTALIKSADYYRVINVIIDPEQRELLETICADILCINYITDTVPANIDTIREVIARSNFKNVARRVIINKCDIAIRPVLKKLGLDESLDFQVCSIPTIPAVNDADLNGYNPYGVGSVNLAMKEVVKYA